MAYKTSLNYSPNFDSKKRRKNQIKFIKRFNGNKKITDFRLYVLIFTQFDEFDDIIIKKELRFTGDYIYYNKQYKLYDIIYTFKRLIPNLIINLEMQLLEKL